MTLPAALLPPELPGIWRAGLKEGSLIPYLGPGVLADVVHAETGAPMPVSREAMILALNEGRPMSPKLTVEFSRAAMNLELKRGRGYITRFLNRLYGETPWRQAAFHVWLDGFAPPLVIDINRDKGLQTLLGQRPHTLICGLARLGGSDFRYRLHRFENGAYQPTQTIDPDLPVLFKPMGTPLPEGQYIASDADYVDFITELMGGFSIPPEIKQRRLGKQYLLLGMSLDRDTERMVLADMMFGAAPEAGWALIPEPTEKARRFCRKQNLTLLEMPLEALMTVLQP